MNLRVGKHGHFNYKSFTTNYTGKYALIALAKHVIDGPRALSVAIRNRVNMSIFHGSAGSFSLIINRASRALISRSSVLVGIDRVDIRVIASLVERCIIAVRLFPDQSLSQELAGAFKSHETYPINGIEPILEPARVKV